jgi:Asp-tRNA(Asn)/Glu-tRNA(Gln) amidotransferase A subunit family amidase
VKDLFDVCGMTTGAGVPAFLDEAVPATADAAAVRALREAGALVLGLVQTDEFAFGLSGINPHFGTPPNPALPGAVPGGSSSGPASAVSLGDAVLGLATDTAGSIRVPASYQGLWGIRTTHGSVSTDGLLALAPSFDTVGWVAKTATGLRAAAETTLAAAPGRGFARQRPAASRRRGAEPSTRFAISSDLLQGCDVEVRGAFVEWLTLVELDDVDLVDLVDLGDSIAMAEAFKTVQSAEAWRSHGDWITSHPGALSSEVAKRFEAGSSVTEGEERAARAALARFRDDLDRTLEGRVLLLPSTPSPASLIGASAELLAQTRAATIRLTAVAAVGGYPAVSAPLLRCTPPHGDAPVGLCLVGARGEDAALIDLAELIADMTAAAE